MTLARTAAERALQDMAAPPPAAPIPCSSAAAIERAEERARHRTPDYARAFAHISRAVRQTILLEIHIADGCPHAEARPPALSDRAPRTRPPTDEAAQNSPHLETLRRETVEKLDHDRPANPLDEATLENLLQAVASTFGQNIGPTASAANPRRPEPNPGQQRQPNPSTPTHHTPEPGASPPDAPRRPGRRW